MLPTTVIQMIQTTMRIDGVDIDIDTNNALELLDLQHCRGIINNYNTYKELEGDDAIVNAAFTPNAANHDLYLIALYTMEQKYPLELAADKLDYEASHYDGNNDH